MKKMLVCSVVLFCLGFGLTITAWAQDPVKVLDTPETYAELEKARQLAGDDTYLQITQRVQCRDIGPDGKLTFPPFPNHGSGEVPAVPTKVFDNVYYVGGTKVGGWLITTSDGYILLDAMYDYCTEPILLPNMKTLGLDPSKVKYILITHGSGPDSDHAGGAKYFQDNYGTRVVMSAQEWVEADNNAYKSGEQWLKPELVVAATDGQKVTLGDTTITIVHTPRIVGGGGLSYIIPIKINGKPHMWATYGNTGVNGTIEDKLLYRKSVAKFLTYTDAAKVDVVISSHPFVDGSLDRMVQIRNSKPGDPNPFVIGQEGARRYLNILDQSAVLSMARDKAGMGEPKPAGYETRRNKR